MTDTTTETPPALPQRRSIMWPLTYADELTVETLERVAAGLRELDDQ